MYVATGCAIFETLLHSTEVYTYTYIAIGCAIFETLHGTDVYTYTYIAIGCAIFRTYYVMLLSVNAWDLA